MPFIFSRYIHQKIVGKDVVAPAFVSTNIDAYMDEALDEFIFILHQDKEILLPYLKAGS